MFKDMVMKRGSWNGKIKVKNLNFQKFRKNQKFKFLWLIENFEENFKEN